MTRKRENRIAFRLRTGMLAALFLLALVVFLPKPVLAATYRNQWRNVKGKYYYYDADGKKATGLKVIRNHKYLFTAKGVQRIGWQEIRGKFYYFKNAFGSMGYMRTNTSVSGIRISKGGAAKLDSKTKRKVKLFVRCQHILEKITNANMTKEQRLKAAFEYAKTQFRARNIHSFRSADDWDMYYAEYMLNHGYGDCYCYAAVFGYLANVVGYVHVKVESSGGHGWVHIGNYYYDPNWALVMGSDKCYAVPSSLSGVAKRPNWAKNGAYVKDLSKK